MGEASRCLLREWRFLEDVVVPRLMQAASDRSPVAWTIGSEHDAVALSAAYGSRSAPSSPPLRVFLSSVSARAGSVHFARRDIRRVPGSGRSGFEERDRRWVPRPSVTEAVVLGIPPTGIDLAVLRPGAENADGQQDGSIVALRRLRKEGMAFWVDGPPRRRPPRSEFRPFPGDDRLFLKTVHTDERAEVSETSDDPLCPAITTLAAKQSASDLVESHMGLARSLARRYAGNGQVLEDLEQVAYLGLVKAAQRYRPEEGAAFSTFATVSILGELKRHFRDRGWMLRVSRPLQDRYRAVKGAREQLGHLLGVVPTVDQVAAHLGISPEAVYEAMEAGYSYLPASLDAPASDGQDSPIQVAVTESGFDATLDRNQLIEALPRLGKREQLVLRRVYFDRRTQREVAEEIGVSQMQISRIQSRAIASLRSSFVDTLEPARGRQP